MATTLTYNGFTDLQTVRIDSWTQEPVLAQDGTAQETTRHVITGTALIHDSTAATWKAQLDNANARLNQPRGDLAISIGATSLLTVPAPDDRDGPFPAVTIKEIVGQKCAVVTFAFEVFRYEKPTGDTAADILSHRWVQRWSYDEVGLATRYVAGSLAVRAGTSASTASSIATASALNAGTNPEAYRQVVAPTLPPGFRRNRMEFATDETGNRLLYSFEDQEFPRGLPYPCKKGDCSFRWEKSLDSGAGLLGIKSFECEVSGDAMTTGSALLAAAVTLSQQRIRYTPTPGGDSADIIQSIRVEELNMLTENRIRFSVVALGSQAAGGGITPSNAPLLTNIMATIPSGYQPPDPYGTSGIRAKRRALWKPSYSGTPTLPVADWESVAAAIDAVVYTLPEPEFAAAEASLVPQSSKAGTIAAAAIANPYHKITIIDTLSIDTGMVMLQTQSISAADKPMQMRKPVVTLRSEATMVRLNLPPERIFRPSPQNSILRHDEFIITGSAVDANNNRVYQASHVRVYVLGDVGSAAPIADNPGWNTTAYGAFGNVRGFWPKTNKLSKPIDPRFDTSLQGHPASTIADGFGDAYPVGEPDPVVRP